MTSLLNPRKNVDAAAASPSHLKLLSVLGTGLLWIVALQSGKVSSPPAAEPSLIRSRELVRKCETAEDCPRLYCPMEPCTVFECRNEECLVTFQTAAPEPTTAAAGSNMTANANATKVPPPDDSATISSPPLAQQPDPDYEPNEIPQEESDMIATPESTPSPPLILTEETEEEEEETTMVTFAGNDQCSSAIGPIAVTAQGLGNGRAILTHGTTQGASADAAKAPTCNNIAHTGLGVWYTVTGTGAPMTASTCWSGTDYDTAISVYKEGNGKNRRRVKGRRGLKKDDDDKDNNKNNNKNNNDKDNDSNGVDGDNDNDEKDNDEDDVKDEDAKDEDANAVGGIANDGVCASLQCVHANDDASGTFGACKVNSMLSRVQWESVRGEIYYLLVHGFNQRVGNFDLNVITARPLNEQCQDAVTIPIGGETVIGTTFQALLPWGENKATNCGGRFGLVGDTSSVWYKVTSPITQTLEASTCHPLTDFDTKLHIFEGSCASSASCLGGNDNYQSPNRCSLTTWTAQANKPYYVLVHAFMVDNGLFELSVRAVSGSSEEEEIGNVDVIAGRGQP